MSDGPALVYLEADDEITGVVRRVRAAGAERVIVVAPGRSRATSSAVALRLLARAGADAGREVVIVGDGLTRSLAAEAGLTAFATVEDARGAGAGDVSVQEPPRASIHVVRGTASDETVVRPATATASAAAGPVAAVPQATRGTILRPSDETRTVATTRRPIPSSRGRPRSLGLAPVLGIAAALLIIAIVAGATLLPAATITITPRVVPVSAAYDLVVDEPHRESGTVQTTATVIATTPYEILQAATGTVTFRNFNVVPVEVPAETLVAVGDQAGDQAFATTAAVTVPPGQLTAEGTIAAGEADAAVVAAATGPAGNVEAGAINRVLSQVVAARLRLFPQNNTRLVINGEPTSGGMDEEGVEVGEADVEAAVEALTIELRSLAAEARPDVGDMDLVDAPPAEPQIEVPEDLVGMRDVPETEISGSLAWEVVAVDTAIMEAEAADRLASDPSIPAGHELRAESVEVDLGAPLLDGDRVVAEAIVTGAAMPELDAETVRGLVAGRTASEAELALSDVGSVDVTLWPGWVGSVPELDWRVEVLIAEPSP